MTTAHRLFKHPIPCVILSVLTMITAAASADQAPQATPSSPASANTTDSVNTTAVTNTANTSAITTPIPNAADLFGLVGDGQADDTQGIQRAFRYGGPIIIPRGTYRVTKPIRAGSFTHVQGCGGHWNPSKGTRILYDGDPNGILINASDVAGFHIRDVHFDGNHKARVGIYWKYATHDSIIEDCAIRHTLEHALYVTRTWYAHFNRLTVRNNDGAGITLQRDGSPLAQGPVNFVTFFQCQSSHNGQNLKYDEADNIDTGYGFGSIGYNSMVNVISCAFEVNGGPGIYLGGHASTMLFQGCYLEHNSKAISARDIDDWPNHPNRPSVGHLANIVSNTTAHDAVVFDTCYIHAGGGIWLRDEPAGRNPIVLRRSQPTVLWAHHDHWEMQGQWHPAISTKPGIFYRKDKRWVWTATPGQDTEVIGAENPD